MNTYTAVVLSGVGERRLVKSDRGLARRGGKGQMKALARGNNSLLAKANGKLIIPSGRP